MGVSFRNVNDCLVVEIDGEIDHHFVDEVKKTIDTHLMSEGVRNIVFDLKNVEFMDSAGIGLIIGRYRIANMLGGTVEIANVTDSIKKVLELSGLLKIIKIMYL